MSGRGLFGKSKNEICYEKFLNCGEGIILVDVNPSFFHVITYDLTKRSPQGLQKLGSSEKRLSFYKARGSNG